MNITLDQLLAIMPYAKGRAEKVLPFLNSAMQEFEINTPARQAAFLAQIGHESAQLRYVQELASGAAYEGRADLGNTLPGDGVKYKGRGYIQVTGKTNYLALMLALDIDCLNKPELLEMPEYAAKASAWWWKTHQLNALADAREFDKITKRVNGGYNGKADRDALYAVACKVLGVK